MSKNEEFSPDCFINRELSWLEFNDRVLREGLDERLPLLERLKFLAIVSSNLDEFFMIRVAGLMQARSAGVRKRDISGMTPNQQLQAVFRRVRVMVDEQTQGIASVLDVLGRHDLRVCSLVDRTVHDFHFLHRYFSAKVLPILTPLAVENLDPSPLLPQRRLLVVALIAGAANPEAQSVKVVAIPAQLPRFVRLPSKKGVVLVQQEEIVQAHLGELFPDQKVLCSALMRITRDADVSYEDDETNDLLRTVEQAVITRPRRAAVRLEISSDTDARLKRWALDEFDLRREQVFSIRGILDATALMEIVNREGLDELRVPEWSPQPVPDFINSDDLWETLRSDDVLLFHPYETFDPVVQMVSQAAEDPDVLAIKQTLYRTSGDSPIIAALERAAQSGKEVTVLVELKARFDESQNVNWARRLEDAGCQVIYGIARYKTHAKALLVIRRESDRIRRYVHLATGNYHDKTARLYSDIGLMTSDKAIATDVADFFNLLTGYSEVVEWSELTIAPTSMRQRFIDMIDREIQVSSLDKPGLIMAKINSLQDPAICRALYRASCAGVKVKLNVRGICCLRPGVKGLSENIQVRSIVDRFLEHARIFYFRNGGNEELYMSSADWMTRNLSKRLEILFPVKLPRHLRRLTEAMETYFADNMKAWQLCHDGSWKFVARGTDPPVRSQKILYQQAVVAAAAARRSGMRFRPMRKPTKNR